MVNHELRELIALAAALGTVEQTDGWQAVAPQVSYSIMLAKTMQYSASDQLSVLALLPASSYTRAFLADWLVTNMHTALDCTFLNAASCAGRA